MQWLTPDEQYRVHREWEGRSGGVSGEFSRILGDNQVILLVMRSVLPHELLTLATQPHSHANPSYSVLVCPTGRQPDRILELPQQPELLLSRRHRIRKSVNVNIIYDSRKKQTYRSQISLTFQNVKRNMIRRLQEFLRTITNKEKRAIREMPRERKHMANIQNFNNHNSTKNKQKKGDNSNDQWN